MSVYPDDTPLDFNLHVERAAIALKVVEHHSLQRPCRTITSSPKGFMRSVHFMGSLTLTLAPLLAGNVGTAVAQIPVIPASQERLVDVTAGLHKLADQMKSSDDPLRSLNDSLKKLRQHKPASDSVAENQVTNTLAAIITAALRHARENPAQLDSLWRMRNGYPSVADALGRKCSVQLPVVIAWIAKGAETPASGEEQGEAECLGVIALQYGTLASDKSKLDTLVAKLDTKDRASARSDLKALSKELVDAIQTYQTAPMGVLFANGDIRTVATGGDSKGTNGTGSLGIKIQTLKFEWRGTITVASTADTLTEGFGAAILTPGAGGARGSGSVSLLFPILGATKMHAYGSVARSTWVDTGARKVNVSGNDTVTAVTAFGVGVLAHWTVGCCRILDNAVMLNLEVGPSIRWLDGDIGSRKDMQMDLLGSQTRVYGGLEAGMQLVLRNVAASLQLYSYFGHHIDGLTGLQLVTAFSLDGELFRGPLTR